MSENALSFIGSFIGPFVATLVAVFVSGWLQRQHDAKTRRVDTLRRLIASRYALVPSARKDPALLAEFFRALNEMFVVFRSPSVHAALDQLHSAIDTGQKRDEELRRLFLEACREVGVPADEFAGRVFMKPFHWQQEGY